MGIIWSDMKHITVGVAGHIDHGKTALVRALTGTETDRLAEEQARGMSIVLGFAHLTLPEGEIDLIDVPGHERFVHTMIAGATGMEAVLLVIAANEIVMPQTREHVALTELLGVRKGLVVITKGDLTPDPDERELVEDEAREFLQGTFLRDAPMRLDLGGDGGRDGGTEGRHLRAFAGQRPRRRRRCRPSTCRVDRVFTMTGHGTVVTGTLRRGALRVGQSVEIVPGRPARRGARAGSAWAGRGGRRTGVAHRRQPARRQEGDIGARRRAGDAGRAAAHALSGRGVAAAAGRAAPAARADRAAALRHDGRPGAGASAGRGRPSRRASRPWRSCGWRTTCSSPSTSASSSAPSRPPRPGAAASSWTPPRSGTAGPTPTALRRVQTLSAGDAASKVREKLLEGAGGGPGRRAAGRWTWR